jgi:hypothetical protein
MTYEESDKWNAVQYHMDQEGIDYCFEFYSSFEEIADDRFHELRLRFIESMCLLRDYVNEKCSEEDDEDDEDDDDDLPEKPRTIIYDYTSASKADK